MTTAISPARIADMDSSELLELAATYTAKAIDWTDANSEHGVQKGQAYAAIAQNLTDMANAHIISGLPHRIKAGY